MPKPLQRREWIQWVINREKQRIKNVLYQNNFLMSQTVKKTTSQCIDHEFVLIPLRDDLYFKQPVTLSFCKAKADPKYKSSNKKNKLSKPDCLCCPVFNKDNNHATSAFILPEQKQNYIENQMRFKEEHECRIKEYNAQKSEIFLPKPKTKQSYCNVCKLRYGDYLEHITSDFHKMSLKRAPLTRSIKEMEDKYDIINQGRNSNTKISMQNDCTRNNSQSYQELEIMGTPNKKLKKDPSYTSSYCHYLPINQMVGNLNKDRTLPPTSFINSFLQQPMNIFYNENLNLFYYPLLYCNSVENFTSFQNPTFMTLPFSHNKFH